MFELFDLVVKFELLPDSAEGGFSYLTYFNLMVEPTFLFEFLACYGFEYIVLFFFFFISYYAISVKVSN